MKAALLTLSLITGLTMAAGSFAATHSNTVTGDKLQSGPASDMIIAAEEPEVQETLEVLLQKLKDPDPFVRVEAVQGLGDIQSEEALLPVCNCLDDENLYVRAYAAEAVGKIGHVDTSLALLRLISSLDDPSPYVRAMMLAALGELQDKRALEPIRQLLNDEDESVRGMAAWAIGNIEKIE